MTGDESSTLVSVVIPAFNRAGLIGRAIDSVLQQTWAQLEIIVVDDASTDDTADVVAAIQDSRIRYLRQAHNAGASAARNTGIRAATGRFVAFLDSDDVWMPDKLELQLAALRDCADPAAVACYTQVVVDSGITRRLLPTRARRASEPVADYVFADCGLIHTSSLMLPRELAARTLFPEDQRKHEDWDLFLRLETEGVSWHYVDRPLVVWHNEPREGRLTNLSHELSLHWLEDHRHLLSAKAISGFMVKEVATPLAGAGQRGVYVSWLALNAVRFGALAPIKGARLAARALIPKGLRSGMKKCLTLGRNTS